MQAMVLKEWGEPSDLKLTEMPDPAPAAGEVAVAVRACGCNFFDVLMVQGKYQVKPPLPFIPGSEISGEIAGIGSGVSGLRPGDRVFAMIGSGGYATRAVVPATQAIPLPAGMSFDEGAAFGIAYQTAYFALVYRADLQPGETLLVNAAAGGVGLAAVQIGRALGARVLAAASSDEKLELARGNGAEEGFDYTRPDWVEQVNAATGSRGADVVYDPVGGDVFDQSTRCLAFGGRLLVIGFTSGRIPSVEANRILLKNISIVGLHWGAYRKHDPGRILQAMKALFGLYEEGRIRPVVGAAYRLEEAAAALEAIASRRSTGKVILQP